MQLGGGHPFRLLVHDRDAKFSQAFDEHRPHRALQLLPPNARDLTPLNTTARLRRRDLLGGLIHDYEAA